MGTVEASGREDEFDVKDSEVRGPGLPWLALAGNSLHNADRQKRAVYLAVFASPTVRQALAHQPRSARNVKSLS